MARYLVTGASGLLGLNFSLQAVEKGHEVFGTVNHNLLKDAPFQNFVADLSQRGLIKDIIDQTKPDVIIHTAALAEIDACERQPELSKKVNAELPGEIASISQKRHIQLIHISTDAVFDGQQGMYDENDLPNPLNTYARHKLEGEKAVLEVCPQAAVARVNFFGWSLNGTRSLSEWFVKKLLDGVEVNGFTDIFFCPLLVNDLSDLLMTMVYKRVEGIYHVLSPQCISKYEFGIAIAKQFELDPDLIKPISWKAGGLEAVRSPNLIFNVNKLIRDLGITPPAPGTGIQRFHKLWQNGYAKRIRCMSQSSPSNP